MAVTGVNNNTTYTDYYTDTNKKNASESIEAATDKQKTEKSYRNQQEYKNYLTEKYDCLTSKEYSVAINSYFLSAAAHDEEKARWLESNLSLIPEAVEKTKATVEARGSKILSYNIMIKGYDSMKAELCTKVEADPGTEKAREELKERLEEKRKEKKAEEKEKEERAAEEKTAEKAAEKESQDNMSIDGKDVEDITRKFVDRISSANFETLTGTGYSTFDVRA